MKNPITIDNKIKNRIGIKVQDSTGKLIIRLN